MIRDEKFILEIHEGKFIERSVDLLTWARWFQRARGTNDSWPNRRISETRIVGFVVSTVFLGLDHAFGQSARPKVYETMIFFLPERLGFRGYYCERCSTYREAVAQHRRVVYRLPIIIGVDLWYRARWRAIKAYDLLRDRGYAFWHRFLRWTRNSNS